VQVPLCGVAVCPVVTLPLVIDTIQCTSSGDPHIQSFWGDYYDCMAVGVVSHFEHIPTCIRIKTNQTQWSYNKAAAINSKVWIYADCACIIDPIETIDGFLWVAGVKYAWTDFTATERTFNGLTIRAGDFATSVIVKILALGVEVTIDSWSQADGVWVYNIYIEIPRFLVADRTVVRGVCTGVVECVAELPPVIVEFKGNTTLTQAQDACTPLSDLDATGVVLYKGVKFDQCLLDVQVFDDVDWAVLVAFAEAFLLGTGTCSTNDLGALVQAVEDAVTACQQCSTQCATSLRTTLRLFGTSLGCIRLNQKLLGEALDLIKTLANCLENGIHFGTATALVPSPLVFALAFGAVLVQRVLFA